MDTDRLRRRSGPAGLDRRNRLEYGLRMARRDAEESWTPGQALGEILRYLDRVEHFTESGTTASCAQKRMRWLTSVLQAAVLRTQCAGLSAAEVHGVFCALIAHDAALSAETSVRSPSAKAARDLIRLEVSYLVSGRQDR